MEGVGQGRQALEHMRALVASHGREGAAVWLDESLSKIDPNGLDEVRVLLARSSRRLGDAPIPEHSGWTARDAGRAALVLQAFEVSDADTAADAYGRWLRRGEQGEQESLLRVLPLLPDPEAVTAHAIDACRTNSEVVFRAISSGNSFPAEHFPPLNFNQLVLKAIFLGVPVEEIVGLKARITDELLRMADDFAAERNAAGRPVPEDVALLHQLAQR